MLSTEDRRVIVSKSFCMCTKGRDNSLGEGDQKVFSVTPFFFLTPADYRLRPLLGVPRAPARSLWDFLVGRAFGWSLRLQSGDSFAGVRGCCEKLCPFEFDGADIAKKCPVGRKIRPLVEGEGINPVCESGFGIAVKGKRRVNNADIVGGRTLPTFDRKCHSAGSGVAISDSDVLAVMPILECCAEWGEETVEATVPDMDV